MEDFSENSIKKKADSIFLGHLRDYEDLFESI